MECLKKLKNVILKVGIPKHVSSGISIHHPLGTIANAYWVMDIVITRDDREMFPFLLQENLLSVSIQVKLHGSGLKGKLFALGNIQFAINVFPQFEVNISKKQFHHLFEENGSMETRIECATKKLDPPVLEYLRNSKNYLYVGGEVTFYCVDEIHSSDESTTKADLEANLFMQSYRFKPFNDLSRDIKTMFMNGIITDLELRCGSEAFQVHKAVLASRSLVFHAMFHSPMKESATNEVLIKDMEPQTLKTMLEYIYSGNISELTNRSTCELLSAADKYELPGLKDICVEFLQTDVKINNVLRVLVYADLHDEILKKCAMEFICKHYENLKTTPEWMNLKSERSELIMEVMDYKIQSLQIK